MARRHQVTGSRFWKFRAGMPSPASLFDKRPTLGPDRRKAGLRPYNGPRSRPGIWAGGRHKGDSPVIKMIWFLRRKEGVSVEAFQTRWRESHSQIVLAAPHIRRYVQSYSIPEAYDFYDPPWDGMVEIWFDNIEEMTESENSAAWKD